MIKTFLEIIVFFAAIILFFFCFVAIVTAQTYNTMRLDCGTLQGKGSVGIWFNDEYYLIPIKCEST